MVHDYSLYSHPTCGAWVKLLKYRPLSDDALKITRDVMRNVILLIIDETVM